MVKATTTCSPATAPAALWIYRADGHGCYTTEGARDGAHRPVLPLDRGPHRRSEAVTLPRLGRLIGGERLTIAAGGVLAGADRPGRLGRGLLRLVVGGRGGGRAAGCGCCGPLRGRRSGWPGRPDRLLSTPNSGAMSCRSAAGRGGPDLCRRCALRPDHHSTAMLISEVSPDIILAAARARRSVRAAAPSGGPAGTARCAPSRHQRPGRRQRGRPHRSGWRGGTSGASHRRITRWLHRE